MDELVRRTDLLVGAHISSLYKYLTWDSIAVNWILFRLHRQAVPYPGDWPSIVMDAKFTVPEVTGMALAQSEISKFVSYLTQPVLMMTEIQEEDYTLGSGWTFLGGLPELTGKTNKMYTGLKRVRTIGSVENGLGIILCATEILPGLVAILRIQELDGRHNLSMWSVVDQETQTIVLTQTQIDRRMCDLCVLMGEVCDPLACKREQTFEEVRTRRLALHEKLDKPRYTLGYHKEWFNGNYTMPVGPLPPMSIDIRCYSSGPAYRYALLSVLQSEVEEVQPPRSSFRFVKQETEKMHYFLNLEVENLRDEVESSKDGSSRGSESTALIPAKKRPGSPSKQYRCETCGMTFVRGYDMKRHVNAVHQKIRDFKCTHCMKTFTQSGHLHEHIRVVHSGVNVFPCSTCKKRFGAESKLLRHIRTVHENARNFTCKVCKNTYKEKAYLKRHLRNQHDVSMDDLGYSVESLSTN
ncbi:hypothetical protein NDN08_007231 [Rhodosorus marinus]|uniref:C2H2-type domain-containing protein n=1 Tax=Rhodosorus marinus TaxID=101924 RepID=A0AAV8UFW8_9RHOD|nr:hypothetical protein NDN08_007231 [Rhodosorus marinus]